MSRLPGTNPTLDASRERSSGWRARIDELQRLELALVRSQARLGRVTWVRPLALALNHLGNGWLYPLLAALLLWLTPRDFLSITLMAGGAAATAHLVYPSLKRFIARIRPCELDPAMPPLLAVLDRYSFPSGHCMTVTAVAIPVVVAVPALTIPAVTGCLLIAWGRLLAAHHYPSDLLAGVALGAVAAIPATLFL